MYIWKILSFVYEVIDGLVMGGIWQYEVFTGAKNL